MTVLVVFLVGVAAGVTVTWAVHLRVAEEHHYRRVRLETTRVRHLHDQADHNERLARRLAADGGAT